MLAVWILPLVLLATAAALLLRQRRRLSSGQAALERSEEGYRLLLEQSLSGVCVYRDEAILYVNERLCRLLGWPASGLVGTGVWRLFHEGDRERVARLGLATAWLLADR